MYTCVVRFAIVANRFASVASMLIGKMCIRVANMFACVGNRFASVANMFSWNVLVTRLFVQ